MATFKNDGPLEQKFQAVLDRFHQQLADEGLDMKIEKLVISGTSNLTNCPCGTELVIDSLTGKVIGKRCKRCRPPAGG